MARISAPVLVAPMEDVLVFEKHRARFQCRISGEGSSERPAPLGCCFPWTSSLPSFSLGHQTLCVQICRFLGSVATENWCSRRPCRCLMMVTGTSWRSPQSSPVTRESTRVWPPTRLEWLRVLQLSTWTVSKTHKRLLSVSSALLQEHLIFMSVDVSDVLL